VVRLVDGEAGVRHRAGGTPEEEREGDRSADGGLRHDAAGDGHEGGGEEREEQRSERPDASGLNRLVADLLINIFFPYSKKELRGKVNFGLASIGSSETRHLFANS